MVHGRLNRRELLRKSIKNNVSDRYLEARVNLTLPPCALNTSPYYTQFSTRNLREALFAFL